MLSLTYVSSASELLDPSSLLDLLAAIRPKNEELGISGLLLYSGGNIIQVLEGPAAAVRPTFAAIAGDSRHRGVQVLLEEEVEERSFPDWAMGFRHLPPEERDEVAGFSDFLQRPAGTDLAQHAAPSYRLLEIFRETMR